MALSKRIKSSAHFWDGCFGVTVEDDGDGNFSVTCDSNSYYNPNEIESALEAELDYISAMKKENK